MSKSKKPRRRYVKGSGLSAIYASQPFSEEAKTLLKSRALAAWEAMKDGSATPEHFDLLAATANVCLIRAESIDQEAVEMCIEAQSAIVAIRARHDKFGRFGVDSEALQVVPALLNFYDQLLDLSTPRQMADAVEVAFKRMSAGVFFRQ